MNRSQSAPPALLTVILAATVLALTGCEDGRLLAPASSSPDPQPLQGYEAALEAAIQSESDMIPSALVAGANELSGPTVITEPGVYVVVEDFSVPAKTGDGIVIRADHVLLIVGQHVLTGPGNMEGRGIVLDGVENVLVAGGILRTFGVGVALNGTSRSSVRRVRVEGGDVRAAPPAIPPQVGILLVNSPENRIGRNECRLVNLGIFVRGGGSYGNRIQRNSAVGGNQGLLGICYNPAVGEGEAGPTDDDVRHNLLDRFGTGIQTSAGSANNRFSFNTIRYFNLAWQDLNGTNEFLHNQTMQISP